MTATRPEDVASMFDLVPEAASPPRAGPSLEDAEAALAAELASALEPGGVASDAPDSRTDRRVEVAWPARMRLADGHVIDLTVRNISEAGMGLVSDEHIPAHAVVNFEMDVPPLDAGGPVTSVKGTIRTTYTVVHGAEILCGGSWVQVPSDGLALVNLWGQRLRA